jgi:P-loop containing dynein motor region D4
VCIILCTVYAAPVVAIWPVLYGHALGAGLDRHSAVAAQQQQLQQYEDCSDTRRLNRQLSLHLDDYNATAGTPHLHINHTARAATFCLLVCIEVTLCHSITSAALTCAKTLHTHVIQALQLALTACLDSPFYQHVDAFDVCNNSNANATLLLQWSQAGHAEMALVLFPYAVKHLLRLTRILMLGRSSALLVGLSGSGRCTLQYMITIT